MRFCRLLFTTAPFFLLVLPLRLGAQTVQVAGKVVDENGVAQLGAKLSLSSETPGVSATATTDEAGRFRLPPVATGRYEFRAEKPGFYVFVEHSLEVRADMAPLEVVLNHVEEFQETVHVEYSPPVVDPQLISAEKTLQAQEIVDMPYPSTHDFRSALPLLPGVIKDNAGRIHVDGGAENQTNYSLDGFNIASPVSGVMENRLSVDALRSVRVETSRYSAEYGKGSSGVMALETYQGDDHYHFMATNFFPSFDTQDGLQLTGWTPRATFSGPIVKGRAWFFNSTDLQYDLNTVKELPTTDNTNRNWNGGNLTRFQLNLTPRNILTAGYLYNFTDSRHYGISPLDPVETSRNLHSRFHFFNVKDQLYFKEGWILESGLAVNDLAGSELPQGDATYIITPEGREGNYYREREQEVKRIQALVNLLARPRQWHGRHDLKFGLEVDRISYSQFSLRHPIEILREDETLARDVSFSGHSDFTRDNTEFSAYAQDRWAPVDGMIVEAGLRFDRDQIIKDTLVSPRLALTITPRRIPESKFSAGVGVFYDATNLDLLARTLDQSRTDVFLNRDGTEVADGPVMSRFIVNESTLKPSYSLNWSLGWEQKLPGGIYGLVSYMRRHGREGWAYDPAPAGPAPGPRNLDYTLTSDRRDSYSYIELTARRLFKEKYTVLLSYARSSARSTAVLDFSIDNTMFSPQAGGPFPWDAPNRLISWGTMPLPRFNRFLVSYFLEWHSGLPYSLVNENQQIIGPPNSQRFPDYFSLNLHVERRFHFWGYEWAIRVGFNNLTGHHNPDVVINNIDSPLFGQYSAGSGRVFTGRIRFLGKK